ncbi:bone morphogenetic protein receptor type-1B-like isoform X2 [Petromyzon marinus]|uniref:bone morphogenetic protein receptor type-1B-like isoform X2 n=1 Tax=Petromyzon marinus TaxID=7757 RepID=UPI003F6EFFA9
MRLPFRDARQFDGGLPRRADRQRTSESPMWPPSVGRCFSLVVIQLTLSLVGGLRQIERTCNCNVGGCVNNTCRTNNSCYASEIRTGGTLDTEYGCTMDMEIRCSTKSFFCCSAKDYCNKWLNPDSEHGSTMKYLLITIILFTMGLAALSCRLKWSRLSCNDVQWCGRRMELGRIEQQFPVAKEKHAERKSLLNEMQLGTRLAMGGFGQVSRAMWRDQAVAAKMILSKDEASFRWELAMYKTHLQSHPNVLACLGSDTYGWPDFTAHYIITELHPAGSLYDFLLAQSVQLPQALVLSHSLASGLRHLHTSIAGHIPKPFVAHRDLKSKNVLVKSNGECCVADFGLSAYHESSEQRAFIPAKSELSGTRRYAPPELLSGALKHGGPIAAYIRGDIYSLGLVLWEIAICIDLPGRPAGGYQMPYGDLVPEKPTLEEMAEVVHVKGLRPTLSPHWPSHPILNDFARTMTKCWTAAAHLRPSANEALCAMNILKLRSTVASPAPSPSL